jgi:death-on-curing protein
VAPRSRKRAVVHLDAAAVVAIHAEVIAAHGGRPGVRDHALLESAVAAPQASHAGQPLIGDAIGIAAAYLFYLSRNRPFMDGNERTGLAACLVFLQVNGRLPNAGLQSDAIDDWEALAWDIAASKIDREQATKRLRMLLRPKRPARSRKKSK